jgi:hypothetical protein
MSLWHEINLAKQPVESAFEGTADNNAWAEFFGF